jgi:hypothetical protein
VLALGSLAIDVKAGHGFFTVPDLPDFQDEQFADPQPGSYTQHDRGPVPQDVPTFEVG